MCYHELRTGCFIVPQREEIKRALAFVGVVERYRLLEREGTGSRLSCEANWPMTDRRSPNADCGCQSIAGGVKGLTDRDCEKI